MRRIVLAVCLGSLALLAAGAVRAGTELGGDCLRCHDKGYAPVSENAPHGGIACGECHVPHRGRTVGSGDAARFLPEWNTLVTSDSVTFFSTYRSRTFDRLRPDISQPDGSSRLCLGCHDGSYPGLLRTDRCDLVFRPDDLRATHPISFTYDVGLALRARNRGLRNPAAAPSGLGSTIQRDLLDASGKMQCTSCHNPHAAAPRPQLLRYEYDAKRFSGYSFCRVCHER